MKVLILGIDGYIGWALANHLRELGHEVTGLDNYFRRSFARSLYPISSVLERVSVFDTKPDCLGEINSLPVVDAIVHLAEQPSAPWSMARRRCSIETQRENVLGTLNLLWLMRENPDVHLIKLGTMGEYGTPNCVIPEGFIEDGPMAGMMFPRQPGSFYHLSKVFDSMNIEFACRVWGMRSTDIMQGVVFGHEHDTRFDYDEYFGTVINRFCAQAVADIPLTVYGLGGQTRGYLPLKDSIECLTLALHNPPQEGEYRVFNQFARTYSVKEIADTVANVCTGMGIRCEVAHIPNPRVEAEQHFYEPVHTKLFELGYAPDWDFEEEIYRLIKTILPYKNKINKKVIFPKTKWNLPKR